MALKLWPTHSALWLVWWAPALRWSSTLKRYAEALRWSSARVRPSGSQRPQHLPVLQLGFLKRDSNKTCVPVSEMGFQGTARLKGSYYAFLFFPSPFAIYICFWVYKWLAKLQYHKVATRESKWLWQNGKVTELPRNGLLGFHLQLSFTSGTRWRVRLYFFWESMGEHLQMIHYQSEEQFDFATLIK